MKTRLNRRQFLKQTSLLSSSLMTAVVASHCKGSSPDFLTSSPELQDNGRPEILYNGIELTRTTAHLFVGIDAAHVITMHADDGGLMS